MRDAGWSVRGFTLMEVLLVVVVLGVLAGLAIPNYFKTVEKAKSSEATANLKTLHLGQKIYQVDNSTFYGPSMNLAAINQNLDIDITQENYVIAITAASAAAYTATATRFARTKTFTINETGVITESGSY